MHEKFYRMLDEDYLENNINDIISLNVYLPSILTEMMCEIYIDPNVYAKWKYSIRKDVNEKLWHFYIKQKALRQNIAHHCIKQGKNYWFAIWMEVLIFLNRHPEFEEGLIKDWDYLEELVTACEEEYNINILDYINDYSDMRKLLKKLRE